jgi:hypothetical protein
MSLATIIEASLLLNWESGRTGRFSAALRRDMEVGQGSEEKGNGT